LSQLHRRRRFPNDDGGSRGCPDGDLQSAFHWAADFVRHALALVPTVISLGRLAFLESEARSDLIDDGPLARVHIFKKRLPMMHRAGWDGPRAASSVCFAWFVFERDHRGKPTLDRI
jgi:hypothetical protein